jgi:hypothetical protein
MVLTASTAVHGSTSPMKLDLKKGSLGAVVAVSLAVLLWMEPVAQDPGYHRFADQRTLFGVPNF